MVNFAPSLRGWKIAGFAVAALGLSWTLAPRSSAEPDDKRTNGRIEVLFSPDGNITDHIVREIERADRRVYVQSYIFTSREVADALKDAKKRGVECLVVADKKQAPRQWSQIPMLAKAGIKVLIDGEHAAANNKIILIDDRMVITGSFNYTKAAEEKNAENVLFIESHRDVFDDYLKNFNEHKDHAKRYRD